MAGRLAASVSNQTERCPASRVDRAQAAWTMQELEGSSRAEGETELAAWRDAMRDGDFHAAWTVSDRALARRRFERHACCDRPRHLQSLWDGTSLAGKRVLIRCYHGLGDSIQFCRFVPAVRQIAREVSLWVQPSLLNLMRALPGVDQVLPLHDGRPDVSYDVDIELMEVMHALRVDAGSLPGPIPYLSPPAGARPVPELQRAARPRIGIVWKAGDWDARRSFPTRFVAQLVASTQAQFFSFQPGLAAEKIASIGVVDVGYADIPMMAASVRELDLVISVDTMMAHLAGSLGVRTWTLLHAEPDWRWGTCGPNSTWYPTMRLFRQRSHGWDQIMTELTAALRSEGFGADSRPAAAAESSG